MLHLRQPQSLHIPPDSRESTFDHLYQPRSAVHDRSHSPLPSLPSSLLYASRQLPALGELQIAAGQQEYVGVPPMDRQNYPSGAGGLYAGYRQEHTPHDFGQLAADARYHTGQGNATAALHAMQQVQSLQSSRPSSRPESPVFQSDDVPTPARRGSQQGGIVSYLQIPSTISSSKGSLAEFAAQITCLFWFETSTTLTNIETSERSPVPTSRLVPEAIPVTGFLKWVTTILSTTQVTQNVILLALLFIYRLKKQNPSVKGKPGSEYRLLTVALMLGNKFLDDNTYTNKTWAEVSGISVQEIHVMEVEFLSHMKYNLYTSKESWHQWHKSLGKFWTYFDRASRKLAEVVPNLHLVRPLAVLPPYTLPSPPASTNTSPPYGSAMSPTATTPYPVNPAFGPPVLAPPTPSPAVSHPDMDVRFNGRKRSVDEYNTDPPAKRPYGYHPDSVGGRTTSYLPQQGLPFVQQSTLTTTAPLTQGLRQHHTPILNPGSTLTPISLERTSQSQSLPSFAWAGALSVSTPSTIQNPTTPIQPSLGHGSYITPMAQHTNYASSASHTTTQKSLSPSHFLTQRSSPYRPVRNISTLLVPPPPGQVPQSANQIAYDQMHWQTLGKNQSQRHAGRVPYLTHEAWPKTNQVEHWPSLYPLQGYN